MDELKTAGPLWRLKVNCLRYCSHVHAHHGAEDVLLFPALRAADPSIDPVVDRLEADHARVSGTYQSTRWRGEQAADSSKGTAARVESSQASTRAGQLTQVDIATFIQWVDADVAGKKRLATFYRQRFRREFRPAFAAWVATNPRTNPKAPRTPFVMPQYRVAEAIQAERLNTAAGRHADAADTANQRSGNYVLAVVLFAVSLFFAGISTKLRALRQREALLALGWLIFLGTAVWVATFPITLSV